MPNSLYLRNRCLRSSISYLYADGVMIVTSRDATPYDFVNLNGGSGGGRTHALRIKSPLPYHLATLPDQSQRNCTNPKRFQIVLRVSGIVTINHRSNPRASNQF